MLVASGMILAVVFALQSAHEESLEVPVREQVEVPVISQQVYIARDQLGIPTIRGKDMLDTMFGEGFVHGQDRFFQMDIMRRLFAGELSAMIGPSTVPMDRRARYRRPRQLVERLWNALDKDMQTTVQRYCDGVNAGLASLAEPPLEYGILNIAPEAWTPHDSLLVYLTMFQMLHEDGNEELRRGAIKAGLPKELYEFLVWPGDRGDVPLTPDREGVLVPPIPGPALIDLRKDIVVSPPVTDPAHLSPVESGKENPTDELGGQNSNNWAIAGSLTSHGGAIVANDPHLMLQVPNIWYRAVLQWPGVDVGGLTLPGLPGVIIGSTGKVAWGFTNTTGDFRDYIIVEVDPKNTDEYYTPDGQEAFGHVEEVIEVRGGRREILPLQTTRWGVVSDKKWMDQPLVEKWVGLEPEMVNLNILGMLEAENLDDAVEIMRSFYGPSQNVMLADDSGRIGWVVSGYLPKRVGFDGTTPMSWASRDVGWDGALNEENRPMIIDPPSGLLYTANNRTMPFEQASLIGQQWSHPSRAARIKMLLEQTEAHNEQRQLEIQLDTQVPFYDFYREIILESVDPEDRDAELRVIREVINQFNGRADIDQRGLALLQQFHAILRAQMSNALLSQFDHPALEEAPFRINEEPLRQILEERPAHLQPAGYDSWRSWFRSALSTTKQRMEAMDTTWDEPWGDSNRTGVTHLLTDGIPWLGKQFNMPDEPLPGHMRAVRVGQYGFGASARMSVSPGHHEEGIFQMPAGQSGDPRSANYGSMQEAWLNGDPMPFLPGSPVSELVLVPQQPDGNQ